MPRPLRTFVRTLGALTLLCLLSEALCRWLHLPYPYSWPLMPRQDPFRDFYLFRGRFAFFHTGSFFQFVGSPYLYPAPLSIVYKFFYMLPNSTETFLGALSAVAFAACVLLGRKLVQTGLSFRNTLSLLTVVVACAYPFYFEFEQANVEWIVCTLVWLGVFSFLSGRQYGAAICFGVAAAMKLYPIIFLGLLLSRRQYRQMAVAVVTVVVTTLASLWLLSGNVAVAWRGTQHGMDTFRETYMLGFMSLGFDHSLFGFAKAILRTRQSVTHPAVIDPARIAAMLAWYLPMMAISGIGLYFAWIRRLPVVNQVICLMVATILLPPVSYDYTLLHLYAAWALLVVLALRSGSQAVPGLQAAMVCLAILFAPESELIVHGYGYGGQAKTLALAALFWISLRYRFYSVHDEFPIANQSTADKDREVCIRVAKIV